MPNELYHYGVLGMKWGVHKARAYAEDTNNYIRKQKNKEAKAKLKSGEYTKAQYKKAKAKNYKRMVDKNRKVVADTLKLTPQKGKKVSTIYEKYKKKAISTIPNYQLKKGAKKAGSLLVSLGTTPFSFSLSGGLAIKTSAKYVAKKFLAKQAYNLVEDVAVGAGKQAIQNIAHKKRKGASG